MSFSGNEMLLTPDVYMHEGGQERLGKALKRLDDSWIQLRRSSLGVLMVFYSGVQQEKETCKNLVSGLLTMMKAMSEACCMAAGSLVSSPPDLSDLLKLSNEMDKTGQDIGKTIDKFMGVVMTQLLQALPHDEWGRHFKLFRETHALVTRELDHEDSSYLGKTMAAEQEELTQELIQKMDELLENQTEIQRFHNWVRMGTEVFDAHLAGGEDAYRAMGQVITTLGFPQA